MPRWAGASGPLVDFLEAFPHTGPRGFEGLVAALLEAATGQRFRIAGSGFQEGMDIASEAGAYRGNRIKAEVKHYFESSLDLKGSSPLRSRKRRKHPTLISGCSRQPCPLLAQHAAELEEQAMDKGVEFLFLDRSEHGLARLDVLMAAYPDVVERFGRAHGGAAFEPVALLGALSAIAAQSGFQAAKAQILKKLEGSFLGYDDARRRAAAFMHRTLRDAGSARAAFNQRLGLNDPTVHKVERTSTLASFDEWWRDYGNRGQAWSCAG